MLGLAIVGLGTIPLRRREGQAIRWAVFVPLLVWLCLLAVSLLNPSHAFDAEGIRRFPLASWVPWLPTTIDRGVTLVAQIPWTTALLQASLWAAASIDRRVVRFTWGVAALNGLALAIVGAAFRFDGAKLMLGFIDVPEPTYFFATFFYKNHWAAYGALCALGGAALALGSWQRSFQGDPQERGRAAFFAAALFFTAITLPMPGSRSGALLGVLLLLSTGCIALLLAMFARELGRTKRVLIVLLLLTGLGVGAKYGVEVYGNKVKEDWARTQRQLSAARRGDSPEIRVQLSRATLKMAQDRPFFGWGLGSYETIFPLYTGRELRDERGRQLRVQFAHNDWLQMAAEAGWSTLALMTGFAVYSSWRGWRRTSLAGRYLIAGCGAIAAYGWIDFPLNNPAVLLLWTTLLASACAQRLRTEPASESNLRPART